MSAQHKKTILAISGSTRKLSTNHRLIQAMRQLSQEYIDMDLFEGLSELPPFNPDNNAGNVPGEVIDFRSRINAADGVIICTPEYAHGVPGVLKNAIDWTVSTSDFSHKPTLLITASTDGRFGHAALLETLRVIEAENIDELQMVIQFAQTKISKENSITDANTLSEIRRLLNSFVQTIDTIRPLE